MRCSLAGSLALKKQASMLCATVERATQQGSEGSLGPTASNEMNAANATKSDGQSTENGSTLHQESNNNTDTRRQAWSGQWKNSYTEPVTQSACPAPVMETKLQLAIST